MMTRRRSRAVDSAEDQYVEIEVTDAVQIEDLQSPPGSLPSIDADDDRLADFFGIEDLDSPLFEMGLDELDFRDELGFRDVKDCDSGNEEEASWSPSPERKPRAKARHHQSGSMVNKNAIAARLNRQKKKEYVGGLESKVDVLSDENHVLKHENSQLNKRVEELEDETRYLRAVLANESMLGQLLSRLSGMKILFQGHDSNDHDYALPKKRAKVEGKETSGGVCLHVAKNYVSVQFCTKCAESASASLKL